MKFKVASGALLWIISAGLAATTLDEVESQLQQGHAEGALAMIEQQLKQSPDAANWLFLKARSLSALERPGEAEQTYRRLIKQHPQTLAAYNNLATLLVEQGRLNDASELLEQALTENDPDYATLYRNLQTVNVAIARASYGKALRVEVAEKPLRLQSITQVAKAAPAAEPESSAATVNAEEAEPALPRVDIEPGTAVLETLVRDWAQAWSEQDVERYLAFYASDFSADGLSRRGWEQQRQTRLSRPQWIRVELDKLTVAEYSAQRAEVEFIQQYRSDGYSDVTHKQLVLHHGPDGWRIVEENNL